MPPRPLSRIKKRLGELKKDLKKNEKKIQDMEKSVKEKREKEVPQVQVAGKPEKKKRLQFTDAEEKQMWDWLVNEQIADLNNTSKRWFPINPKGLLTWRAFRSDTGSTRSVQSIHTHFRRYLKPTLRNAPIDMMDMWNLYPFFEK